MKKVLVLFALTSALTLADGERGPRGYQGPPGPAGPVGPAGPQGIAGAPGRNGNDGVNGSVGPAGRDGEGLTLAPFYIQSYKHVGELFSGSFNAFDAQQLTSQYDQSVRFSFSGSKGNTLQGMTRALMPGRVVEVAIQQGFGFSHVGMLFALRESATGRMIGLAHLFDDGWQHGGGLFTSDGGGTIVRLRPVTYADTRLVWFRAEGLQNGGWRFKYSSDGIYWAIVGELSASDLMPDEFALLGYDGSANVPYSFVLKHLVVK